MPAAYRDELLKSTASTDVGAGLIAAAKLQTVNLSIRLCVRKRVDPESRAEMQRGPVLVGTGPLVGEIRGWSLTRAPLPVWFDPHNPADGPFSRSKDWRHCSWGADCERPAGSRWIAQTRTHRRELAARHGASVASRMRLRVSRSGPGCRCSFGMAAPKRSVFKERLQDLAVDRRMVN